MANDGDNQDRESGKGGGELHLCYRYRVGIRIQKEDRAKDVDVRICLAKEGKDKERTCVSQTRGIYIPSLRPGTACVGSQVILKFCYICLDISGSWSRHSRITCSREGSCIVLGWMFGNTSTMGVVSRTKTSVGDKLGS